MSRHPRLYHRQQTLARRFPQLPKTFVVLLALWTLGMVLARRRGLGSVALFLARTLGRQENTPRRRLREFYQEKTAKAAARQGRQRRDFAPSDCFAPLPQWIPSYRSCPRLVLALDPTTPGERPHVLCVSVVYRGLAIPVAWKILPGRQPEPWRPHWCARLDGVRQGIGRDWEAPAPTDRGLESPRLFRMIVGHGWRPLMRVQRGEHVSARGLAPFPRAERFRRPRRCALRRRGPGLQNRPHAAGWHAVGLPGSRSRRAVVVADRPAAASRQPLPVRVSGLDRAGIQGDQKRRPAVAIHAQDRSRRVWNGTGWPSPWRRRGWRPSAARPTRTSRSRRWDAWRRRVVASIGCLSKVWRCCWRPCSTARTCRVGASIRNLGRNLGIEYPRSRKRNWTRPSSTPESPPPLSPRGRGEKEAARQGESFGSGGWSEPAR